MSEQKVSHAPLRFAVYRGRGQSGERGSTNIMSKQDSSRTDMPKNTVSEQGDSRKSMPAGNNSEQGNIRKSMSAGKNSEQDDTGNWMSEYIAAHPGSIFTAEYIETDPGFRQFQRMLEDARTGSFDCILADSVSSFGRNTKTALAAIERLRELGIGVVFQKENINTLEKSGQELLDVISAFAAKKSRSHSEAIHRALQENFASGKPGVNLNRMLGYDLSPDGETWLINEEQAKIVRFIFESYAAGVSANQIARDLNGQGARTVNGNIWRADTIMVVLRNEKYAGDLEMQKTVSSLDGGREKNTGQLPKHYETNHHAAIIDRDLWDLVQAMLQGYGREKTGKKETRVRTVFGSLICAYCGGSFRRCGYSMPIVNYTDERSLAAEGITGEDAAYLSEQYVMSYSVWRCENKYRGHEGKHGRLSAEDLAACDSCPNSPILYEIALEQSFMEMLYRLKREYQEKAEQASFAQDFRAAYKRAYDAIGGTGAVVRRTRALEDRIRTLTEQAEAARRKMGEALSGTKLDETASISEIYMKLIADIEHSIAECEEEKKKLSEQLDAMLTMKKNYDFFLRCLKALPEENAAGEQLNIYGVNCQKRNSVYFERETQKNTVTKNHQYREIEGNLDSKATKNKWQKNHDGTTDEDVSDIEEYIFAAPDFLNFDKSIYLTFFPRGEVRKDSVEYTTNFGVKVSCPDCGRDLNSFIGFRQVDEDGELVMITENWQVNRRQIQYRRKERKYRKRT